MNLSSNKEITVTTCDGVELHEGLKVYRVCFEKGVLQVYTILHWHNGIDADLYGGQGRSLNKKAVCFVKLSKHYEGPGFYDLESEESGDSYLNKYNMYTFHSLKDMFACREKAEAELSRQALEESKRCEAIIENTIDRTVSVTKGPRVYK